MAGPQAGRPGHFSLDSLPNDLLLRCFAYLDQEERLGLVARVSRRFRSLCLAPELLHRVDFTAKGEAENAVRRLHAFLAFLLEHAQHVRVIHLNANLDLLPARERDAAAALVASCLLASNRLADALEHLTIHPNTPLITTAWLPGLTALTKLTMGSVAEKLNLPPDFSQLRALASAELAGRPLGVDEGARLPPGLTRLRLRVSHSAHIMHQVSQLTGLQQLELSDCHYRGDGLRVLSGLTQLTSLRCDRCFDVPPCLSMLTQLEQLVIDPLDNPQAVVTLVEGISHLRQLTTLYLSSDILPYLPPSITTLQRLQRLCVARNFRSSMDLYVPPGKWLASLHFLGLPWKALPSAIGLLEAASAAPEHIVSTTLPWYNSHVLPEEWAQHTWHLFWRYLDSCPSLRCFVAERAYHEGSPSVQLLDTMFALQQRHPDLQLRWSHVLRPHPRASKCMVLEDGPIAIAPPDPASFPF